MKCPFNKIASVSSAKFRSFSCTMRIPSNVLTVLTPLLYVLCVCQGSAQGSAPTFGAPDYDQLVSEANTLLKGGNLNEASQEANKAIQARPGDYIAYAVAAKIASKQGNTSQATTFVNRALELAPTEAKDKIRQLAAMLTPVAGPAPVANTELNSKSNIDLGANARIKRDVLAAIIDDAENAKSTDERQKYLSEFLDKSDSFVRDHPEYVEIWEERAAAALELGRANVGWQAGRKLLALGAGDSNDQTMRKVIANLERKGWLVEDEKVIDQIQTAIDRNGKLVDNLKKEIADAKLQLEKLDAAVTDSEWDNSEKLRQGVASWNQYLQQLQSSLNELGDNEAAGRYETVAHNLAPPRIRIRMRGDEQFIEEKFESPLVLKEYHLDPTKTYGENDPLPFTNVQMTAQLYLRGNTQAVIYVSDSGFLYQWNPFTKEVIPLHKSL